MEREGEQYCSIILNEVGGLLKGVEVFVVAMAPGVGVEEVCGVTAEGVGRTGTGTDACFGFPAGRLTERTREGGDASSCN